MQQNEKSVPISFIQPKLTKTTQPSLDLNFSWSEAGHPLVCTGSNLAVLQGPSTVPKIQVMFNNIQDVYNEVL